MHTNILNEFVLSREEDLKIIIHNLIKKAITGEQWAIELVMRYLVKHLLSYRNYYGDACYECLDVSERSH